MQATVQEKAVTSVDKQHLLIYVTDAPKYVNRYYKKENMDDGQVIPVREGIEFHKAYRKMNSDSLTVSRK